MDASDASVNNDIIARTMNNCAADGSFSAAAVCIWTVNDAQFNATRCEVSHPLSEHHYLVYNMNWIRSEYGWITRPARHMIRVWRSTIDPRNR